MPGKKSFAVSLPEEQVEEIKAQKGYETDGQVKRFLQALVDVTVPKILEAKK